jgi:hypothetical protein
MITHCTIDSSTLPHCGKLFYNVDNYPEIRKDLYGKLK